jgi:putative secretion ATPase (PEP-CTERM system associated)
MYESFYGFTQKPFQIAPNPAFLYKSDKHQNALAYLEYGLAENVGFILLTGEIGSGKTTLVQYIVEQLDPRIDAAVVFNTNVTAAELLGLVMDEFEIPREGDKARVLGDLNRFLVDRYAQGHRALLIIDEAQNLSDQALEEVRLLSNLQTPQQPILQIMLVGQPELSERLKSPAVRQFAQRIAASYHLTGLDRAETGHYVDHRLAVAGGRSDLFTPAALDLIFELSGGIPRSINLLCQAALVYGFAEEAERISQDIVRQIQGDNLGIGPGAAPTGLDPAPPAPGAGEGREKDSGFGRRLVSLEDELKGLKELMSGYLRKKEKETASLGREQFTQLIDLVKQERRQKEDLLREVTRLEVENRALRRLGRQLQEKLAPKARK